MLGMLLVGYERRGAQGASGSAASRGGAGSSGARLRDHREPTYAQWREPGLSRGDRIPGPAPVGASRSPQEQMVGGVGDTVFMFQRAAAVPGSPSPLVHAIFATVRALITVAGGYFVVRAVLRLRSLRRLGA